MESFALLPARADALLDWYLRNARDLPWRRDPAPYRVWISEIMLQQTRVEAGKAYFLRFVEALPDAAALAAAPEEQLLKLWEGLGYYNRVRNLQKAARIVCERYGGALPASFEALLALPGIGAYTAGAIASIAFGLPAPAVDGNVLRVLSRFHASEADTDLPETKRAFEAEVRAVQEALAARGTPAPNPCGAFTQALMELGALVCLPNGRPLCERCPWADCCAARATGRELSLPRRSAKKARGVEKKTVFLIRCGDSLLLRKRPAKGLLAGLWELPNLEGHGDDTSLCAALQALGLPVSALEPLPSARHVFTHKEWLMQARAALLPAPPPALPEGFRWASPEDLAARCALPSAFSYWF